MEDPNALKIYTDGSAFDNPGKRCGWGMVVEFPDNLSMENEEHSKSIEYTTINRMELTAVIEAIMYAKDKCRELSIQRVIILSDSDYVTSNHSRASTWRKNDWFNYHGKPIENSDLWKKFLSVMNSVGVRTEIKWIAGKSSEITKRVDKVAKSAAKSIIKTKDSGFNGGKISKSISKGVSVLYDKGEGSAVIRVYSYKVVKDNLLKVKFEMSTIHKEVVENTKYNAYCEISEDSQISRHHTYIVNFNGNKHFPVFVVEDVIE